MKKPVPNAKEVKRRFGYKLADGSRRNISLKTPYKYSQEYQNDNVDNFELSQVSRFGDMISSNLLYSIRIVIPPANCRSKISQ